MPDFYGFGYRLGTKAGYWIAERLPVRVAVWYGRKRGWL